MIIDCTSDLHGSYPNMRGGDLMIVAGDLTANDSGRGYWEFFQWIMECKDKYKKIIVIAGNHDGQIEKDPDILAGAVNLTYLQDSGCEFEGLKLWGSPWTPEFCNWHFMLKRGKELRAKWALIPDDTDILITHGPPKGVLDKINRNYLEPYEDSRDGHLGCDELRIRVAELRCKLHVFGHIHEGYGITEHYGRRFVNCSHMDRRYNPVNEPIRVIL